MEFNSVESELTFEFWTRFPTDFSTTKFCWNFPLEILSNVAFYLKNSELKDVNPDKCHAPN